MIEIAPGARVSRLADIEASVRGSRVVIGAGTVIDAFVRIKPAGGAGDLEIGPDRPIRTQGFRPSRGGICIGDDVWIGANCVLLDGARIGRGSVVGASSLVRGWRRAAA